MNTLMVVMAVLTLVLMGITVLLLITLLYNTNRTLESFPKILEHFPVLRLRQDNIYEKVSKIEYMLQMDNTMLSGVMDHDHRIPRAIRTPGGIIMATSLEDFLTKIHNDPQFKGISKDQLEELRRLFEEDTFNDEDGPDEPWQEKK